MDVWRITVAALRRWYILLPLLALTGVAALGVGEGVRPQYEVTGTAIITPPRVGAEVPNPYGSMNDATTVVTIVLGSNEVRERVAELGLDSDYEVAPRSRSSIWNFTVVSDSPEMGMATGEAILELAVEELADRQGSAGIPTQAQMGLDVLQAPSVSAVVTDGKTRNMAVVGLLGASLSLLAAVLFDDLVGLVKRWRRRRREGRAGAATAGSADVLDTLEETEAGATPRAEDGDALDGSRGEPGFRHGPRDFARAGRDG